MFMIPRYTNPHLLPQRFQIVSRADLYADDGITRTIEDSSISQCLTPPSRRYAVDEHPSNRKRRKLETNNPVSEGTILFRLVSSSLPPLPLALFTPPPPAPVTREPDEEDNEEQALFRQMRSESSAIDGTTVLREAQLYFASQQNANHSNPKSKSLGRDGNLIYTRAAIPNPAPPSLILTSLQKHRKTRPPVPSTELSCYPYVSDPSVMHPQAQPTAKIFPVVDIEAVQRDAPKSSRRQRRKRLRESMKERPAAQFWRPHPSLGTCRGYAWGFPDNLAVKTSRRRD